MAKKRVLFITSTFPLNEEDTQVPWMVKLIQELNSEDMEIDVFAPSYRGISSYGYHGIKVFRFRYAPFFLETLTHNEGALTRLKNNPLLYFVSILYILFGSMSILNIVRKHKYDVIHVHWPMPQGIFGIIAKTLRPTSKLVFTFYGAEFSLTKKILFGDLLLSFLIKKADVITAISTFTKSKIQSIVSVPVEVIPFGSAVSKKNNSGKVQIKKYSPHILFVGRLIERKGVIYLIRAMKDVLKNIDVCLDIVGVGPLFSELENEVKKNNLDKHVFLHGNVNEQELENFYRSCDVFVLPSVFDRSGDTEGLGVVILEAMSFGKPVIASNVGGIVDIVKNNVNGLLVPQKDPKSLGAAVVKILKSDSLCKKFSANARDTADNLFSWSKIISDTKKIYGFNKQ